MQKESKLDLYKEYERRALRGRLIIQGANVEQEMLRIEREYISQITNKDIPVRMTVAKLMLFLDTSNYI